MSKFVFLAGCATDAMCAFDTAALPDDFDDQVGIDPVGLRTTLQREGRLWYEEVDDAEEIVCHVYIDETLELDEAIEEHILSRPEPIPIVCPSGALWILGAEFVAKNPRKGSKHTHDGGWQTEDAGKRLRLKRGTHQMQVIHVDKAALASRFKLPFSWKNFLLAVLLIVMAGGLLSSAVTLLSVVFSGLKLAYEWMFSLPPCTCRSSVAGILSEARFALFAGAAGFLAYLVLNKLSTKKNFFAGEDGPETSLLRFPDYILDIKTEGANPAQAV